MDSDILATNNFMDVFIPFIDQYSGIFSGTAIGVKEEMQVMKKFYLWIGGKFNKTIDGTWLGSTFFAMYNNKDLTGLLDEPNITFNKYHGWHKVPDKVHKELIKLGMKAKGCNQENILIYYFKVEVQDLFSNIHIRCIISAGCHLYWFVPWQWCLKKD